MPGKKYSFGSPSRMKALEPGQTATLKFLDKPKVVETEYGEKYSISILLLSHPHYPSISSKGMELVWETKAQVIEKDLVPLLKNNPEFTKDYLEHKWEVRIDDGGAVRIEG
jgi:hypothetical protein